LKQSLIQIVISYLNVPFDVSKVVFVATANRVQTMPAPLLDRMEVIELPGYTPEEKLHIAMRHLIPRVLEQHGITNKHIKIPEACWDV
jgi:ATP-dependent Lon protease